MHEPSELQFIVNFNTKNLNKASYLISIGASYVRSDVDENGIASIYLDNVTKKANKDFWLPETMVNLWTFLKSKESLVDRIKETGRNQ